MNKKDIKKDTKLEKAVSHEISDDTLDGVAGGGIVDIIKDTVGGWCGRPSGSKPSSSSSSEPAQPQPSYTPNSCPVCGQSSTAWIFITRAADGSLQIICDDCGYSGPLYP